MALGIQNLSFHLHQSGCHRLDFSFVSYCRTLVAPESQEYGWELIPQSYGVVFRERILFSRSRKSLERWLLYPQDCSDEFICIEKDFPNLNPSLLATEVGHTDYVCSISCLLSLVVTNVSTHREDLSMRARALLQLGSEHLVSCHIYPSAISNNWGQRVGWDLNFRGPIVLISLFFHFSFLPVRYRMAATASHHMVQRNQQQQQQPGQTPQSDPSFLSAQAALNIEDSPPVRVVQIAALVLITLAIA